MNIIIPMAGAGKRMRPHTLTTPKPLLPLAGKPIVQRLVEDIAETCKEKIDNIAFVVGRFGAEAEKHLLEVAARLGAKGHICYQDEPLGTAHAILCAKELLQGNVFIAFADTLFKATFDFDKEKDAIIWCQKIEDPSKFGVVTLNDAGEVTAFVEKPDTFVSDLAIIGVYYFKDGENLRSELQYLVDNDLKEKGEYQLTNAMETMRLKTIRFYTGEVEEWLDCGNKDATVYTNQRILSIKQHKEQLVHESAKSLNSVIIPPCFIGEGVEIVNSVVGPYVSLEKGTKIHNSIIKNSIVQSYTHLNGVHLDNSMIGNQVSMEKRPNSLSMGDYTTSYE